VIGVSFHSAVAGIPVAILEGTLVILPRANPLSWLTRLRSPGWIALLPGSIIVGTFGLLLFPSMAFWAVLAAAVTAPLLAALAVLFVSRAPSVLLPSAAAAAALAMLDGGSGGRYGTSVITALACMTVGAGLQRLIPGRWLLAGVVSMSAVDVALLGTGFGYHQTALLAAATSRFPGPLMTGARLGTVTIGYPDLCLAAVLGASVAGTRDQTRAAVLLTALAIGWTRF